MLSPEHTLEEDLTAVSLPLGEMLSTVREGGETTPASWSALTTRLRGPKGAECAGAFLGALALLRTMGAVRVSGDSVITTSRSATLFLGSLGKLLEHAVVPLVDSSSAQSHFSTSTEYSERLRLDSPGADHEPLHHRRIVNIIVKRRMKRRWGLDDVYLFVYHPKWKAYHLIGLSQKRPEETDDVLIAKAMDIRLDLRNSTDYEIDPNFRPADLKLTELSRTNGASTEYTYRIVYASKIVPELHLTELTQKGKEGQGPFRWFTLREIECKKGDQGEEIIFSTPMIMQHIREDKAPVKKRLPLTEAKAEDVRPRINPWFELGRRLTARQFILFIVIPIVVIALSQALQLLHTQFSALLPGLGPAANLVTILSLIPMVYTFGTALLKKESSDT